MSLLDTASLVITPNGTKASKLYSVIPSDGSGDMTVTRATDASYRGSNGLIQYALPNVPRLDYSNGTCPSILVEPQRTNLLLRSQEFDNSYWVPQRVTVSNNALTAPDGTNTADTITAELNLGEHNSYNLTPITITSNQAYTYSYFVKKITGRYACVSMYYDGAGFGAYATYDLNTNTLVSSGAANGTYLGSTIQEFDNGWVRISISGVGNYTGIYIACDIRNSTNLVAGQQFFGAGESFGVWGAQLEAGSYATSYIPTTSASVTRNADVISKTGISSLIGQTSGTVFLDFVERGGDVNHEILGITLNGGGSEFIALYSLTNGALYFVTNLTGGVLIDASSFGERFKVAYSFTSGNHVLYVNGVQIYSSTIAGVYSLLNAFYLGVNAGGTGQQLLNTNSSALWKTRLTNTQLQTLTTI